VKKEEPNGNMDQFINNLKAIAEDDSKKSDVKIKVLSQYLGANYKVDSIDTKPFDE